MDYEKSYNELVDCILDMGDVPQEVYKLIIYQQRDVSKNQPIEIDPEETVRDMTVQELEDLIETKKEETTKTFPNTDWPVPPNGTQLLD